MGYLYGYRLDQSARQRVFQSAFLDRVLSWTHTDPLRLERLVMEHLLAHDRDVCELWSGLDHVRYRGVATVSVTVHLPSPSLTSDGHLGSIQIEARGERQDQITDYKTCCFEGVQYISKEPVPVWQGWRPFAQSVYLKLVPTGGFVGDRCPPARHLFPADKAVGVLRRVLEAGVPQDYGTVAVDNMLCGNRLSAHGQPRAVYAFMDRLAKDDRIPADAREALRVRDLYEDPTK